MSPIIAKLIREGRLRKGMNQETLAQRAGVARSTLYQLERGEIQTPRASTLAKLAEVLELDQEQLAQTWKVNPGDRAGSESSGQVPIPQPWKQADLDATASSPRLKFDEQTNLMVVEMRDQFPEQFADLTADEWNSLVSQVGVGGGLTSEGVAEALERIRQERRTLEELKTLLQTHLRTTAQQVISAMYQSIQVNRGGQRSTIPHLSHFESPTVNSLTQETTDELSQLNFRVERTASRDSE